MRNMNTTIQKQKKGSLAPSELPDWLVSHGLSVITTEECAFLLGLSLNEVPQRLVRLRSKGQLVSAARGLWIVVPAEYREMGAPEPIRYIHHLMEFYECEYSIGWMTAASFNGASHQAPQVFQVAVGKQLRDRMIGRSRIHFIYRSYVPYVSRKRMSFSSGSAVVSTPGATMLMAAADPAECAGIDNAATIICELAEEHPDHMKDIMMNTSLFPKSAVRRLGWILDRIAGVPGIDQLADFCAAPADPAVLAPGGGRSGRIDKKWKVIENRRIEADI